MCPRTIIERVGRSHFCRVWFLALGVLVTAGGCGGSGGAARRQPPVPVDVIRAERRDIAVRSAFDGQIVPLLTSTLSSPQSGNVIAVYVNEGDRVREGVLLAKIDDASLLAQLAQARGQLAESQGHLGSAVISSPIQTTQYGSSFAQARATIDADEAALRNAALVYTSNARLYPQGYIAQTALEQSRASYVAARQQMNRDRDTLRIAAATLGQTQADLQNIAADRGTLEQARGLVRQLHTEVAQTEVRAPFDGVVTARLLDPGAFASPNQPILTVSQLRTVYVDFNVPDDSLAYVHPGTETAFTTTSLPGVTFHGKVLDVNAVPTQGTLSYRARMRYPNVDDALRGGMLVNVVVTKELHRNVVVVPRDAVTQTATGAGVFVVRGDKAVRVPVTVGLQTDTEAEIRGVKSGELVVTTRSDMLQDGVPVAVANDAREGKK
jgi:HlyD family secretion protein